MEHSLLHGLQLCGLIFALGGALFRLLVLGPSLRALPDERLPEVQLDGLISRWIFRALLAALVGTALDFFVQVAEIEGETIYGGVSLSRVFQFVLKTTVGNLALTKAALLLFAALWSRARLPDAILCALLIGAAIFSTLVSHSAALPGNRAWAITAQFFHIVGAAFWLGILAYVLLAANRLSQAGEAGASLLARLVARYSPMALGSAALITVSGIYSASRFIISLRSIPLSPYGLTLTLKIVLLGFVAYAGFLNWRWIRPRLNESVGPGSGLVSDFLRLLEFELTAGILLISVAGILGAISPPSEPGIAQLNSGQARALTKPRLPPRHFVDPATFVGAASRTDDDLRYAEFTHQWSGVFVVLLGACWFGQSISRRHRVAFGTTWPLLLIPFGGLISAFADPEVWILRTLSLREVLTDPQILEHQVGAGLVFVLAFLGLRDQQRAPEFRPLGYAFPLLVIAGSLMLLGHAHSNLGISEELSSLINMEHAVIGGLGLLAGTCRWLQIRKLPGQVSFRWLWPTLIMVLGLFMAFFYRELTPMASPTMALQ